MNILIIVIHYLNYKHYHFLCQYITYKKVPYYIYIIINHFLSIIKKPKSMDSLNCNYSLMMVFVFIFCQDKWLNVFINIYITKYTIINKKYKKSTETTITPTYLSIIYLEQLIQYQKSLKEWSITNQKKIKLIRTYNLETKNNKLLASNLILSRIINKSYKIQFFSFFCC